MMHTTQAPANTPNSTWLRRICSEYRESPGLSLTLPQASRFFGLDESVSAALFDALMDAGFLRQTKVGRFVQA